MKANVSNTGRFVRDMTSFASEALFCCFEFRGVLQLSKGKRWNVYFAVFEDISFLRGSVYKG